GNHPVSANYNASATLNPSSGPLAGGQTVSKANTTTAIASSANPSVNGQSVTFTATVSTVAPGTGTRTGTITFTVDGTNQTPVAVNGSGQATFGTNSLSVGNHIVSATY